MDAFEWWSNKNHGFVVDYAYIDTTAPTKHIRHEARAYLGEITINDHQAAEIWNELQNCRAGPDPGQWTHRGLAMLLWSV